VSWIVRLAKESDAAGLDRLRAVAMAGTVRLSLVVPSRPGDRVVVAERDGEAMAMGVRTRGVHAWDGIRQSVGVLTGMRSRFPVLPRRTMGDMYDLLLADRSTQELDWDLTAILEGNLPARRLLEAGIPGVPRYTPAMRLSTLTFRSGGGRDGEWVPAPDRKVIVAGGGALVERHVGRITRVEGYARALASTRPVIDGLLRCLGRPGLPQVGRVLSEAFVAEARWEHRTALSKLAEGIREAARTLGARLVHWGVPTEHPDLRWLKSHLAAWETRSVVYAVHRADQAWSPPADLRLEVGRL